jgi:predicted metal-dependent hydrolase
MRFSVKKCSKANSDQLTLPFGHSVDSVRGYFEVVTGKTISLIVTDNSTNMLSVRSKGKCIFVRLQRIFLQSSQEVIDEIAEYIKKGRGETPLLKKFVIENLGNIKVKSSHKRIMKTRGRFHNLREIFDALNKEYFDSRITCAITWGTKISRRFVKMRTLGSFDSQSNIIRINPVIDSKKVPKYFLSYIVYHEMLHADIGFAEKDGRYSIHSKEFRKREKLFKQYKRALAWEKDG